VYSPGNVKLDPKILNKAQEYICDKLGDAAPANKLPVSFVFHGGSGSEVSDIREAIGYGVIKMNIDTDTQWSYWEGIKLFEEKYHDYLQAQIGNPEGRTYYLCCLVPVSHDTYTCGSPPLYLLL
jgi:fructose-bisphosphate aldolase class II